MWHVNTSNKTVINVGTDASSRKNLISCNNLRTSHNFLTLPFLLILFCRRGFFLASYSSFYLFLFFNIYFFVNAFSFHCLCPSSFSLFLSHDFLFPFSLGSFLFACSFVYFLFFHSSFCFCILIMCRSAAILRRFYFIFFSSSLS